MKSIIEQKALMRMLRVLPILAAKRVGDAATVAELEAEIDTHVSRLHGLTPEETALIQAKP